MIITYPKMNTTFELFNDRLNSIVIERNSWFEEFVISLYRNVTKAEESITLSENLDKVDLPGRCDFIISPFDLQFDKREIKKKLFAELEHEIHDSDIASELAGAYSIIYENMSKLSFLSDYNLVFSTDMHEQDLLKFLDVHIEEPQGTFAERFIDYADNLNRLIGKDIFFIANCHSYITEEEYAELDRWAKYKQMYLVLINQYQKKLQTEKNEYIIDMDLCELH